MAVTRTSPPPPRRPSQPIPPLPRYLALAYAALVIYASLHPFAGWRDLGVPAFAFLEAGWPRYWTAFDLATNIVAYVPLGSPLFPNPSVIISEYQGGRVVTCGASSGWDARTDLRHVFFRQIQLLGSTMGSKAHLHRIVELVARGELRPIVDRRFPLAEAAEAQRYLDRREQFGKVVLDVQA